MSSIGSTAIPTTTSIPPTSDITLGGWVGISLASAFVIAIFIWLAWAYKRGKKVGNFQRGTHEDLYTSSSTLLAPQNFEQKVLQEYADPVGGEEEIAMHSVTQAQLAPTLLSPPPSRKQRTSIGFNISIVPNAQTSKVSNAQRVIDVF